MIAVTNETMRASDKATIYGGVKGTELMLRAAKALLTVILTEPKHCNDNINIFCGIGNNGGDGYALAVLLYEKQINFKIYGQNPTTDDAKFYYEQCKAKFANRIFPLNDTVNKYISDKFINETAVDCLYGSGYHGRLCAEMLQITSVINKHSNIISCDIPSGLNGYNGIASNGAVKASHTVAIGCLKIGHLLNDGKDYCGIVSVADIGIEIIGEKYKVISDDDCRECFPPRVQNSHKGSYGKVKIIACNEYYVGAGILSATSCVNVIGEAALTVGAGLCVLNVPDKMLNSLWGRVLHCTLERRSDLTLGDCVIAYGMGVGCGNELLPLLLSQKMPLLIDADGITELADNLEILKDKNCEVLLTPHPKEMSRLTGIGVEDILSNLIDTAKSFAKKYNVTVLLKGCTTIVTDGEKVAIIAEGTPAMAKGGSGDVLSGIIAGLIAKGNDLFTSASVGAFISGRAGKLAEADNTQDSVNAIDTANCVKTVVKNIIESKNR